MITDLNNHVDYYTQQLVNNWLKAEIELYENISPIQSRTVNLPIEGKFIQGSELAQDLCNVYTAAGFTLTITAIS